MSISFQQLLAASAVPMAIVRASGRIEHKNEPWRRLFHDVPVVKGIIESSREFVGFTRALQEDAPQWVEIQRRGQCLRLRFAKIEGTDYSLIEVHDATKEQAIRAALEADRSTLTSVVSTAPILLFSVDGTGAFRLVNGMEALGIDGDAAQYVGRSIFEVYGHVPALLTVVRSALEGNPAMGRVSVGNMTFEVRCSPTPQGRGAVGVALDISDQARLERQKNELLSVVSHELRTPLTSIHGSLRLLAEGLSTDLDDRAQRLVQIASSNTRRLVRLINDILDLDKIDSGKFELELEDIEPGELIVEAREAVTGLAEPRGIELRTEISTRAALRGDRDRVVQVLVNLISNAIKYSPDGGVVEIAAVEGRGRHLRFEVRDQGDGIPQSRQSRLFRKFEQLEGSKAGTGLGLVIAKALVEAHHGTIGVDSTTTPPTGTTFHFELPSQAEDRSGNAPYEPRPVGDLAETRRIDRRLMPDPLSLGHDAVIVVLEEALCQVPIDHGSLEDAYAQLRIHREAHRNGGIAGRGLVDDLCTMLDRLVTHRTADEAQWEACRANAVRLAAELRGRLHPVGQ